MSPIWARPGTATYVCLFHIAFSAFCQLVPAARGASQVFCRGFITDVALLPIMTTVGEEGNGNAWQGKTRKVGTCYEL